MKDCLATQAPGPVFVLVNARMLANMLSVANRQHYVKVLPFNKIGMQATGFI